MEKEITDDNQKKSMKKFKKLERKMEKINEKKDNKIYLTINKELVQLANFFINSKTINEYSNVKNFT